MRMEGIREIANAVLYEGYLLYPYRHSAIKNRTRWTLGVVYPKEYSEANGSIEPWFMQTECLLSGSADTTLDMYIRFLHVLVAHSAKDSSEAKSASWSPASNLVGDSCEEGMEREFSAIGLALHELINHPHTINIAFAGGNIEDEVNSEVVREQKPVEGIVSIAAEQVSDAVFRLSIRIENTTPGTAGITYHNAALLQSFISTHTILQAHAGEFISLLDPPENLKELAQGCKNVRTWPVLIGQEGERDALLSSPIILYDYPQIAPESPGPLFDGTEIDEILTLRILTLTDEEKEEMRQSDARAREILERAESLTPEQFMKLHGTIRGMGLVEQSREEAIPTFGTANSFPGEDYPPPQSISIANKEVKAGDKVRLHPRARADAFDMLLEGKTARVEMIQQDFENRLYLVVTLDDDPGREQWDERVLPGHRFFFFPEEVEPLEGSMESRL
ncbi:MAG TPA: hypothetical protein VFA41_22470 [Ktedonobacteraceae bacterium]|nr:hypothetical protein [Ktedonobacteraceae bacterium]